MVVTNALGAVFTATLLSASDPGATFLFPEDGATNTIAWSRLAPASRDAVCREADFVPVPPQLAATFAQARRELARIDALLADARMDADAANVRRKAVESAFLKKCALINLDREQSRKLLVRLVR